MIEVNSNICSQSKRLYLQQFSTISMVNPCLKNSQSKILILLNFHHYLSEWMLNVPLVDKQPVMLRKNADNFLKTTLFIMFFEKTYIQIQKDAYLRLASQFCAKHIKNQQISLQLSAKSQLIISFFYFSSVQQKTKLFYNHTHQHSFDHNHNSLTPTYKNANLSLLSQIIYVLKSTLTSRKHIIFIQQSQHSAMELHFEHNSSLFYILAERQEYSYEGQVDMLHDQECRWSNASPKNFNFLMEEIINKFTLSCPLTIKEQPDPQITPLQNQNQVKVQKTSLHSGSIRKKQKKIRKTGNSPFHNYQKHLNNALKKLIIMPEFQPNCDQYKKAARQIWNIYRKCNVKTKRILHFIFNEKNQHAINEPQLKTYRLLNVYRTYQHEVITKAKNYLSKLAIDQLDEQNVEGYLKTRKLKKNKDCFKEYILGFKSQLQNGYLKRRVIGQKVQTDQ